MVQTQTQRFPIGKIEVIDHSKILRIRRSIPNGGRNIVGIILCIQPTGVTLRMRLHIQKVLILLQHIPCAFLIFPEVAGGKAAGNDIDILGCLVAVSTIPCRINLLAIDTNLIVVTTRIAGNGQRDGFTDFTAFLVCGNDTIGNIRYIDLHIFTDICQLKGKLRGTAIVAVQREADFCSCFVNAAGLTACKILGKIISTDLLPVQINISTGIGELNPEFDTPGHNLCGLFLCQGIANLPFRYYRTAVHSLDAVNPVFVGMMQTNTELLAVGELKQICQRIIFGVRRQVCSNSGNIIGNNHRLQYGIYALCSLLIQLTFVLTGDVPGLCMIQERRSFHIHSSVIFNTEGNVQYSLLICPGFQSKLRRKIVIFLVENLNLNQLIIQPNSRIIALAHNAQFNTAFAGVSLDLLFIQRVNSLPVRQGIFTGYFGILQNIVALFLQQINMPGLPVTEPDLHTGSLLGIFITCAKNCHTRIEFQGSPERKIIIVGL